MFEEKLKYGMCGTCKHLKRRPDERTGVCKIFEKFKLVDDFCESDKYQPNVYTRCDNCWMRVGIICISPDSNMFKERTSDSHCCSGFIMGYELTDEVE